MALTAEQQRNHGRIGAYKMHSRNDVKVVSAPGRKAAENKLDARLLTEIDPDGTLPEAERARRLGYARKAHFSRLALKSAQTRRRGRAAAP